MEYSFRYGGKTISLPKYSFNIANKLEEQEEINSGNRKFRDKCRTMYDLIKSMIGSEKTLDLLGEFEKGDVDPNEINIIYLLIVRAYSKPLESFNNDEFSDKLREADVDKIVRLIEAVEKANSLKLN